MINQDPLFKARGDISAGEIKIFKDIVSLKVKWTYCSLKRRQRKSSISQRMIE